MSRSVPKRMASISATLDHAWLKSARARRSLWEIIEGPPLRAPALPNGLGTPLQPSEPPRVAQGLLATSTAPSETLRYLAPMLGFAQVTHMPDKSTLCLAQGFCQWGIRPSRTKASYARAAAKAGLPTLYVEDGLLLRSMELGLSGTPALAVLADTETSHYDATRPSLLEHVLNGPAASESELRRARSCIDEIVRARISKYNHAPDVRQRFGSTGRRHVLVIDQRRGDASVTFGGGCEESFFSALTAALDEYPSHGVLVKRHPDAISGGRRSYFDDHSLGKLRDDARVVLVDQDINPYVLFEQVDAVYVVSSGMGFEALLYGLPVRVFGLPFYASWGVTQDALDLPRRRNCLTVEALFFAACTQLTRYYRPDRQAVCSIEEQIDWFAGRQEARSGRLS